LSPLVKAILGKKIIYFSIGSFYGAISVFLSILYVDWLAWWLGSFYPGGDKSRFPGTPLRLYHIPAVILYGCIMISTLLLAEIKEFPEFPLAALTQDWNSPHEYNIINWKKLFFPLKHTYLGNLPLNFQNLKRINCYSFQRFRWYVFCFWEKIFNKKNYTFRTRCVT